jgi:hypothetical protein
MKNALSVLAGAVTLVGLAAGPASAAGAEHEFFAEDYDAYESFAAGEGPCVAWAGTFHEVRTGGYRLVAAPGGREEGEFHINGVIHGFIELIPNDDSLPTYSGTYREKVNGVIATVTEDEDVERVGQFRLRSTLHGTDGTTIPLRLWGKVTVSGNGDTVVDREALTCA